MNMQLRMPLLREEYNTPALRLYGDDSIHRIYLRGVDVLLHECQ